MALKTLSTLEPLNKERAIIKELAVRVREHWKNLINKEEVKQSNTGSVLVKQVDKAIEL